MLKKYKKNIFDVGLFNGINGLGLAIKNPGPMVYAFEVNPEMITTNYNKRYFHRILDKNCILKKI